MNNLKIAAVEDEFYIPAVDFNAETGVCNIIGESYIEQTNEFYEPLIEWLNEFLKIKGKPLIFNLRLAYYNTSTSKKILEILQFLKDHEQKGSKITFNWYFDTDDIDIKEDVIDFKEITGLDINMLDDNQE